MVLIKPTYQNFNFLAQFEEEIEEKQTFFEVKKGETSIPFFHTDLGD